VAVPASGALRSSRSNRWVPILLIALAVIPISAGTLRLIEVFGGPHNLPANPRIAASPAPVVVHILSGSLYAVLGAFQFSTRLRRRHPRWHRASGRLAVALGLGVALSALWMMAFYNGPQGTRALLPMRFAFGVALAGSLALGVTAIRRRDIRRHQAWMTRAYALALVAGTQVFTLGFGKPVLGTGELATAVLLLSAWVINLTIAEYLIRRPRRPAVRSRTAAAPSHAAGLQTTATDVVPRTSTGHRPTAAGCVEPEALLHPSA
jgi:uncharacterized membrane protein